MILQHPNFIHFFLLTTLHIGKQLYNILRVQQNYFTPLTISAHVLPPVRSQLCWVDPTNVAATSETSDVVVVFL